MKLAPLLNPPGGNRMAEDFAGFQLHHNYPVGKYRADFLIVLALSKLCPRNRKDDL